VFSTYFDPEGSCSGRRL